MFQVVFIAVGLHIWSDPPDAWRSVKVIAYPFTLTIDDMPCICSLCFNWAVNLSSQTSAEDRITFFLTDYFPMIPYFPIFSCASMRWRPLAHLEASVTIQINGWPKELFATGNLTQISLTLEQMVFSSDKAEIHPKANMAHCLHPLSEEPLPKPLFVLLLMWFYVVLNTRQ